MPVRSAPIYHVLLMLPFMAYGVVLLGLNLLFGYTGLVSFGHALFIGLGAYTAAFLTGMFKIRSLEADPARGGGRRRASSRCRWRRFACAT